MNNVNPILFHYNLDENGEPKSIDINGEQNQISPIHYSVQLKQRPDEENNLVVIDDLNNTLSQVEDMEDITENTYYVDYHNALVYFHRSKAGKTFVFNYWGVGYELIGASRVYDEHDVNGQTVVKTLQEIIDRGRECIDALNTIGNAIELLKRIENYIIVATELDKALKEDIKVGNQLHIDLTNDISTGSTLHKNLTNDITVGDKLHNNLTNDISTGTTLDTNLKASITEGNTTKSELDKSRLEAQDDIATIKATGNGTWTIPSSAWVGTEPNLTCVINHKMNSKNLLVGVVDTVTQKSVMNDYEIVDMNNIKMLSMEASNITVTINSQYYSGKDANIIAQEVQDARGVEADLKTRLDKNDAQLINIKNKKVYAVDFGVQADGIVDDTIALQNAIDSLKPNIIDGNLYSYQNCGGVIILPHGNIRITKPLRLYSNITIEGSNKRLFGRPSEDTVLTLDNIDNNIIAISLVGLDTTTKLHSNKLTITGEEMDNGVVSQTWNVTLKNFALVSKTGNNALAINISGSVMSKLENISFENFDVDIFGSANWDNEINNCTTLCNFSHIITIMGNTLKINSPYINPSESPKTSLPTNHLLYTYVDSNNLTYKNTQTGIINTGLIGLSVEKPIIEKVKIGIQNCFSEQGAEKYYNASSFNNIHMEYVEKAFVFKNSVCFLNGVYAYITPGASDYLIEGINAFVTGVNIQPVKFIKLYKNEGSGDFNFFGCVDEWVTKNKIGSIEIGKTTFSSYQTEAIRQTWQKKTKELIGDTTVEIQYADVKEVNTCMVNTTKLTIVTPPDSPIDVKNTNTVILNCSIPKTVYGFTARENQEFTVISLTDKISLNGNESSGKLIINNGVIDPIPSNGVMKFICINGVCYEMSRSF